MIEITSAVAAFKSVKELAKVVFEAKIDANVQEKVNDVMEKIGEAQDTMYALREENIKLQSESESLKRQLLDVDVWTNKLAGFEMRQTIGGAVVYQHTGEPPYYACPSCVNEKRIVPLQDNRTISGKYRCVSCNAEYPIKQQSRIPPADLRGHDPMSWMSR
jgi:predicted RNA-binding Zn-ribbon protein involved in translation (DUF1610 family)